MTKKTHFTHKNKNLLLLGVEASPLAIGCTGSSLRSLGEGRVWESRDLGDSLGDRRLRSGDSERGVTSAVWGERGGGVADTKETSAIPVKRRKHANYTREQNNIYRFASKTFQRQVTFLLP